MPCYCYYHSHSYTYAFSFQQKGIEIWARPIMPVFKGKYSYAIVFLNRRTDGTPSEVRLHKKGAVPTIFLPARSRNGFHEYAPRIELNLPFPPQVSVTLKELGLDHKDGYHITDLYDDYDYGIVTPDRRFKVDVNPSGSE